MDKVAILPNKGVFFSRLAQQIGQQVKSSLRTELALKELGRQSYDGYFILEELKERRKDEQR